MSPAGFPHSDILGSTSARDSPGLNAACHVLHRLLAPRHPPRALCSLTPTAADHEGRRVGIRDHLVALGEIEVSSICRNTYSSLKVRHPKEPRAGRAPTVQQICWSVSPGSEPGITDQE